MPSLQNRGRNRPPIPEEQPGFGGGQVSFLRSGLLQPDQYVEGINIDLTRLQDAVTRRGSDQLSTEVAGSDRVLGMAYFDTTTVEKLVRIKKISGTVKLQSHDGTPASNWADISGWNPTETNASMAQGNNLLFISNGTDNMRKWDGTTLTDMGTTFPNPPKCRFIIYATNRLIAAGDPSAPDTVYFSGILAEGTWSGANSLRVGAGDGDPIVGLLLWTKTLLVVFKRSSVHVIDINPATTISNMLIDSVSSSIGCVGPRAFARVGKDVWFYTDNGLRSLQRVLSGEDTEVSPPVSYPVTDVLDRINKDAIDTICCTFYNDRFMLAVPLDAATQPNHVLPALVFADGPRWLGTWTGWAPTIFVRSYIGGAQRLNIGQADGRVLRWRDFVRDTEETTTDFKDVAAEIPSSIESRSFTFGDPMATKQGFIAEAEFNASRAEVSITPILDGAQASAPIITAASTIGVLTFPVTFPLAFPVVGTKRIQGVLLHSGHFREIAFLVSAASGKMALRNIRATAFVGPMAVSAA